MWSKTQVAGLIALLGIVAGVHGESADKAASYGAIDAIDTSWLETLEFVDLGVILDLPEPTSNEMVEFERMARLHASSRNVSSEGFTRILTQKVKVEIQRDGITIREHGEASRRLAFPIDCANTVLTFKVKAEGSTRFRLGLAEHHGLQESRFSLGPDAKGGSLLVSPSLHEMPTIWLPPSFDAEQAIYMKVGQCDDGAAVPASFVLDRVVLLPADEGHAKGDCRKSSGSDWESCAVDVSCVADASLDMVSRAVALISYVDDESGLSYVCSASLVSTRHDQYLPYLVTADHCISSDTEAASMVGFFDFRSSTCDGEPPATHTLPMVVGADLKAGNAANDMSFLLAHQYPAGPRAFLGWSSTQPVGEIRRVSHPSGTAQKFSRHVLAVGGTACPALPHLNYIYNRTVYGSTTGGSSGSALVNTSNQLLGQLYGTCGALGLAECDYASYRNADGAFSRTYPVIEDWLEQAAPVQVSPNLPIGNLNSPPVTREHYFRSILPSNAYEVTVTTSGSGHLDLYVSHHHLPLQGNYHCAATGGGAVKSCTLAVPPGFLPSIGIRLSSSASYSNVTLNVQVSVPPSGAHTSRLAGTSFTHDQTSPNGSASLWANISADRRYVVFGSAASNLLGDLPSGVTQIFRRSLDTLDDLAIISRSTAGLIGNASSSYATVSASGRYVAFASESSNLVDGVSTQGKHVFVRDTVLGTTRIASVKADGSMVPDSSNRLDGPSWISNDGRYVLFGSSRNLTDVPPGIFRSHWIYVKDMQTGAVEEISPDEAMHYNGYDPIASADGRYVVFIAQSRVNGIINLYLRDRSNGATELITATPDGMPSSFDASPYTGISADGRRVVFYSMDPGLDPAHPGLGSDERVFVRLRGEARTVLVSLNNQGNPIAGWTAPGPKQTSHLSVDGRYVLFQARTPDLPGDNNSAQTYLRDMSRARTLLVSVDRRGFVSGQGVILVGASADLSRIAYYSSPFEINHWLIDAGLLSDPENPTPHWQHVVANIERDLFRDGFER